MRFKCKDKPEHGDRRTIKKFAILPIKIDNEIRWLETVYIFQICNVVYSFGSYKHYWKSIEFSDKKRYEKWLEYKKTGQVRF